MYQSEILNVLSPVMSAVAAVAAAVAAFFSLKVSRRANDLSEKSILANHHYDAALALSNVIDNISQSTRNLSSISYELWTDWSREIEAKDDSSKGGINPRPLRHVLTNGSRMLVHHGALRGKWFRQAQYSMFSIIRNGMGHISEVEYNTLLKKADHSYVDFEGIFGLPSRKKSINEYKAFRWVYYQLIKRVSPAGWSDVWEKAWLDDGWISRYQAEFTKVQPVIEQALFKLREEKNKVEYSVLPLSSNPTLHEQYERVLSELEVLLKHSNLKLMESYKGWRYDEEIALLVIYCMGIAYMTNHILESVGFEEDWL